jgi:hypothetical protein
VLSLLDYRGISLSTISICFHSYTCTNVHHRHPTKKLLEERGLRFGTGPIDAVMSASKVMATQTAFSTPASNHSGSGETIVHDYVAT